MASRTRPHYRVKWSGEACQVTLMSYAGGVKRVTRSGWFDLQDKKASLEAAMLEVGAQAGLPGVLTKETSG